MSILAGSTKADCEKRGKEDRMQGRREKKENEKDGSDKSGWKWSGRGKGRFMTNNPQNNTLYCFEALWGRLRRFKLTGPSSLES